jgi:hypothetical protein
MEHWVGISLMNSPKAIFESVADNLRYTLTIRMIIFLLMH